MTDIYRITVDPNGVKADIVKISEKCTSEEARKWCRSSNDHLKSMGVKNSYFFYQ